MANTAEEVFDHCGTRLLPQGSVVFIDMKKAESGYIHHSEVPVAATAFTLISPAFARGRFPRLLLSDVVLKRLSMDTAEATALLRS